MDTPPTAKNWRLNAAAIIMDAEGCVLLGKDSGRNPYWHFPQGGVIKHESIEQTLAREVWEEVGLRPTEYTIVSRLPGLRYKYPSGNRKVTRWIGQEQTYFLVRCKTRRPKTDLHRSPEFSKTKWIPLQNLKLEMFPKFKRKVIKNALQQFFGPGFPSKHAAVKTSSPSSPSSSTLTSRTMNRYLVPPGKKLRLKDYSPDDKSLFSGTKEESLIEFDKLREELQELQKKLFAQHKHKILVILQAMDAGGKDGCVKHVFSRVDPQGLHVVPFKKPTTEELDHDFLWRVHKEVPAKVQIFNVVDQLVETRCDGVAAAVGNGAEINVEIGNAILEPSLQVAIAHGQLVKVAEHGHIELLIRLHSHLIVSRRGQTPRLVMCVLYPE